METYNSLLRYFFPLLFLFLYEGCNEYKGISKYGLNNERATAVAVNPSNDMVVPAFDCADLKKYDYNGFYEPSVNGKLFRKKEGEYFTDSLQVSKVALIDFSKLKLVKKGYGVSGYHTIGITLTNDGRKLFKTHTANNVGKKIAIIIKDELIMAPIIHSEIPGGEIEISGSFTSSEANKIYTYLNRIIKCSNSE